MTSIEQCPVISDLTFSTIKPCGERWMTSIRFTLGLVWINGSIFEDAAGQTCFMWPGVARRGGGWRKSAGCVDLTLREQVERVILDQYREWRDEHLPADPAHGEGETLHEQWSIPQYCQAVASGADPLALLDHLKDRAKLRVITILLALRGLVSWKISRRDTALTGALVLWMNNHARLENEPARDRAATRRRLWQAAQNDQRIPFGEDRLRRK